MNPEIADFLQNWSKDPFGVKPVLTDLIDFLSAMHNVKLSFKARPGISHSVRAHNVDQKGGVFFVFLDVIDDKPDEPWLSVCFNVDLVLDPKKRGDVIPAGEGDLKDSICFSITTAADNAAYLKDRLLEAYFKSDSNDLTPFLRAC